MQTAKSMPLRVKKQSETAMKIAEYLESHPKVTKVRGLSIPSRHSRAASKGCG